jgi:hypothetical protein
MLCPQTHLADEIWQLSGIGLDVIVIENNTLLFVVENRLFKMHRM